MGADGRGPRRAEMYAEMADFARVMEPGGRVRTAKNGGGGTDGAQGRI
jgi:hypothetical protein